MAFSSFAMRERFSQPELLLHQKDSGSQNDSSVIIYSPSSCFKIFGFVSSVEHTKKKRFSKDLL